MYWRDILSILGIVGYWGIIFHSIFGLFKESTNIKNIEKNLSKEHQGLSKEHDIIKEALGTIKSEAKEERKEIKNIVNKIDTVMISEEDRRNKLYENLNVSEKKYKEHIDAIGNFGEYLLEIRYENKELKNENNELKKLNNELKKLINESIRKNN